MVQIRLKELIEILRKNPNSFAQELGVSASIIYNIIGKRGSKPSCDVLEKIKQTYPQVNMNWLILGEDQPLLDIQVIPNVAVKVISLTNRTQHISSTARQTGFAAVADFKYAC
jgi:hypothetical protein